MMSTGTQQPRPAGGDAVRAAAVAPRPGGSPGSPGTPRRPDTAARVIVAIVASLALVAGLGMLVAGGLLLVADRAGRDSDGYLTSPVTRVETGTYAVTGGGVTVHLDRPAGWLPDAVVESVRLGASSPDGTPLFLGVGPQDRVEDYLSDVAHHGWAGDRGSREPVAGGAPAPPPTQDFWVASSVGPEAELTWDVTSGSWSAVLMDAEGRRGVVADVTVGLQATWLGYVAVGVLVVGALLTALGGLGVAYALRDR